MVLLLGYYSANTKKNQFNWSRHEGTRPRSHGPFLGTVGILYQKSIPLEPFQKSSRYHMTRSLIRWSLNKELQARLSSDFVANENVQSAIRNVHAMLLKKSALASAVSDRDIPLASSDDSF
ncbi:unnamed protein product [Nesidiocoris tenuis]|uniref:Uncharacterized protein n=1 Tax=Nesidiocoris tenuis TaxID=355587 RepID=A0A6H5HQ61_9HEMI|nr:unnamed protein product [Nesidiocoris tenuis]